MKPTKRSISMLPILLIGMAALSQMVWADYPVAGVTPDQRPAGAPSIERIKHDKAWYEQALTGVSRPYPRSLYFLDNQGDWYTPFNRPGMTGYYDIRGWYGSQRLQQP